MKKLGCTLLVLGSLVAAAGGVNVGMAIKRAVDARVANAQEIQLGTKTSTPMVHVDTSKLCMVALRMTITSPQTHENSEGGKDQMYRFPVNYRVLDSNEKELQKESTVVAWDSGTRSQSGGVYEHSFQKFNVPAPGDIRVEIEVMPDEQYNASATGVSVKLYDNVSQHTKTVVVGVMLLIAGALLIVIGGVMFIVSSVK